MPISRGIVWLSLLPYLIGVIAFIGAATLVYQWFDNNWATDAGIAEGRKRQSTADKPKIDRLEKFEADTIAAGKKAEQEKLAREEADRKRKEQADAEHAKTKSDLAGVYDAYRRLREQRARSSVLPEASPASASTNVLTLDRTALDRGMAEADGVLQSGAEKILRRGDEAITDLNNAKRWGQAQ